MKNSEKLKFISFGFALSVLFFSLISTNHNPCNDSEIGRYQVFSSGSHNYTYAIILDTKTGDFIETGGIEKMFESKKIKKGNFKQKFAAAE